MKYSRMLASGFALTVAAHSLLAQVADDELEATVAALPVATTKLPPGPSAIVYNDQSLILSRKLGARLGTKIDHEVSKLVCPDDSAPGPRCSLKDGISLVNLSGTKVEGDRAKAYFTIEIPSNSPWHGVESSIYVVDLVRGAGTWTVKGIRLFTIS
jgi:hypothetical protein